MQPTPVLLPGNMCDARLWTEAVRATFSGAIDADLTQDGSIQAMAERALAVTDGKLLAVGFSMGAIVAVEMAVQIRLRQALDDLDERGIHGAHDVTSTSPGSAAASTRSRTGTTR